MRRLVPSFAAAVTVAAMSVGCGKHEPAVPDAPPVTPADPAAVLTSWGLALATPVADLRVEEYGRPTGLRVTPAATDAGYALEVFHVPASDPLFAELSHETLKREHAQVKDGGTVREALLFGLPAVVYTNGKGWEVHEVVRGRCVVAVAGRDAEAVRLAEGVTKLLPAAPRCEP